MISVETTISEAEEKFMHYKLGILGNGFTKLISCIFSLDDNNRAKIALGFPELVDVINRYGNEKGYWENLVSRYNKEFGTSVNP
jgi:hypothetical protein